VVRDHNITQLEQDLAKLLMSVKQGFVHIIVYDVHSVRQVIVDVLNGTENARVYYPEGNTVDTNGLVVQFVDQLLFREGSWRSCAGPCANFELAKAFSIMSNDKTIEIFDDDAYKEGDQNLLKHSKWCIPFISHKITMFTCSNRKL
jgi:rRNA processing protein Krr1/Pno1